MVEACGARSLRQSLLASQGDMMIFVERPLSAAFLVIGLALFIYPFVQLARHKKRQGAPSGEG